MQSIELIIENEAIGAIKVGIETLDRLEALFQSIKDCAEAASKPGAPVPVAALMRVKELAGLGGYVAADMCNLIDSMRETFEREHLSVILKAAKEGA